MNALETKIQGMDKTERLQTMEVLWDYLIHETQDIDSPVWHKDVLSARQQKIHNGTAEFITLEALKSKHCNEY